LCPIVVLLFVVISSFLHGFYWELSCLMASLSQGLPYCVSFLVSLPPPIIAKTNTNPWPHFRRDKEVIFFKDCRLSLCSTIWGNI
jgi:hypothetical protein